MIYENILRFDCNGSASINIWYQLFHYIYLDTAKTAEEWETLIWGGQSPLMPLIIPFNYLFHPSYVHYTSAIPLYSLLDDLVQLVQKSYHAK